MYISKKLKQLRLSLSYKQEEMAEALGVSQSYYSSIERGKKQASKILLTKINNKWNIDLDYFEGKNVDLNEIIQDKIVGGNVGDNMWGYNGNSTSSRKEKLIYALGEKMLDSIRKDNPELFKIREDMLYLPAFSYALEEVFENLFQPKLYSNLYFNEVLHKDYSNFKSQIISDLEDLKPYGRAFSDLSIAIKNFYKNMKDAGSNIDFEIFE